MVFDWFGPGECSEVLAKLGTANLAWLHGKSFPLGAPSPCDQHFLSNVRAYTRTKRERLGMYIMASFFTVSLIALG